MISFQTNFAFFLLSFGIFLARQGFIAPIARWGEEEAQAEALGAAPKLLLHGCEVSRMLQNHNSV